MGTAIFNHTNNIMPLRYFICYFKTRNYSLYSSTPFPLTEHIKNETHQLFFYFIGYESCLSQNFNFESIIFLINGIE